jgi:hypothetical protein
MNKALILATLFAASIPCSESLLQTAPEMLAEQRWRAIAALQTLTVLLSHDIANFSLVGYIKEEMPDVPNRAAW